MEIHTIDAKNGKLGRIASEAAAVLMGKDTTVFERNVVRNVKVHVINAGSLDLTDKKKMQTKYVRYSGYPGGLKTETLGEIGERLGFKEGLRKSIKGMLPANKLRDVRMQNLTISE